MKIQFDGGYGRLGKITAKRAMCDGCNKYEVCIVMDNSEHEYAPGHICKKCIKLPMEDAND